MIGSIVLFRQQPLVALAETTEAAVRPGIVPEAAWPALQQHVHR